MKLATFVPPGGGDPRAGEVRGDDVVTLEGTVLDRLASGDLTPADGEAFPLSDVTLLAPVPRPRATFGIGLNYRAHAEETGGALPEQPIVFMKLPSSSAPPFAPVPCPPVVRRLDYEGELAVVMGFGGQVAGYAVADDVSARDLQKREPQWTRAKGSDGFCPWGPWITTADEVPPLGDAHARARRPHPHRHAVGRRRLPGPAGVPAERRRRAHRDRAARRHRARRRVAEETRAFIYRETV
jgi:2-keto-4-pentenoate hydratase/2-oxohepta-3-ene-1,7-dioic acid hydratase in catechol pathway